jgi:hypothetical protein
MNESLKLKRNESGEVSFGSNFVSVLKTCEMVAVETNIAATLSKPVDRAYNFSIEPIHTIMIEALKSKRNESGEVSFCSKFVASVLVAKNIL